MPPRDRGLAGIGLPGEGLIVGNDARDLRPRTHQVKEVEGNVEPLVAAVAEVGLAGVGDRGGRVRLNGLRVVL